MRAPSKILGAIAGISMLATTLGIGSAAFAASPTYYDIYDLTTLAQTAANGLYQAGIMNGTAPGKFSPTGVVTRAQAVKFVVNLSGVQLQYPKTPSYSDVSTGSQYYPYIETALADGFLTGYAGSSGDFDPSTPVTRVDLAILIINAMGDQSVAQSLATNTTLYKGLKDLSKVPAGDLGYANAGMKLGFVPPLNSTLYSPNGGSNREELAVGLWRAYEALTASAPKFASVAASPATVGVGQASILTTTVQNAAKKDLTASQLAGYTISYSVTGTNASTATVTSNGTFVASASGNYTVEATISGGLLSTPITATTTVGVYGAATAFVLKPANASLEADDSATDVVTVEAVDANGNVVGNYSGSVTVTDTEGLIGDATTAGDQPSDFTSINSTSGTVALSDGTGTFALGPTSFSGESDSLTVTESGTALTAASATVTTVAPTAATLDLSIASDNPSSLSANTQVYTEVQVAFEDSAGNTLSSGVDQYVTLTLSGPGSFVSGTTPVTTYSVYDPGTVDVPVYSEAGQPGTVTVSATSSGTLTAAALDIPTYVNTTPAAVAVTATNGTDGDGNAYTEYTVTVNDTNGHPITDLAVGTEITVSDNSSAGGGVLKYSTSGDVGTFTGATPYVVTFGTSGVAAFYVETATVGTGTVTLTIDGTAGSADGFATSAPYTYEAGVASAVALTPENSTDFTKYNVVGGTSVTFTAQVTDGSGNPVAKAGEDVTFEIASNSAGVEFPNGIGTVSSDYTVVTNSSGVATLTLTMPNPGSTETFQLAASLGSTFTATGSVDTPTVYVAPSDSTAGVATQLVPYVAGVNQTTDSVTAGTSLSGLTVVAENGVGGDITTGDTLSISSNNSNSLDIPSGDSEVVTNGSGLATIPAMTVGIAGTAILTVTDLSVPSQPKTQFTISVNPGTAATQEVVEYNGAPISTSNPVTVAANTPVEMTVVNADSAGDPIPVTGSSGITDDLAVAGGITGGFLTAPGGAPLTSVTIDPGQSSVIVYFESTSAETLTGGLTASATAAGAPTISTATEAASGVAVTWGAVSGAQSYNVLGSANGGAYTSVATGVTSTTTTVTGLTAGDSYTFEVESVVGGAASAASVASTAVEYGTKETSVGAGANFIANTSTAAGSVTFTVTMDKTVAGSTPGDFTVDDSTAGYDYTVSSVTVSGDVATLTCTIPANAMVAAATDTVKISGTQGALADTAGAPSAAFGPISTVD